VARLIARPSTSSGARYQGQVRDETWTRRRLQALLLISAVVAVAVCAAATLTTINLLSDPSRDPRTVGADHARQQGTTLGDDTAEVSPEDELAARPMRAGDPALAQPGPLSTRDVAALRLPPPTGRDTSGVATGFPHTPIGALAQLVVIDQTALQSVSIPATQALIERWAAPGGPTPETWSGVAGVAALLSAADVPADGTGQLTVTAVPSMGLIKGTVGDDYVVPCVNLTVTATLGSTTLGGSTHRTAVADCQRMTCTGTRWVIGP
jgi:hypothetical protein